MPDYNLGTARGRVVIDASGAERGFSRAERAQAGFVGNLQRQAGVLRTVGIGLTAVGGAAVAGFAVAVKAAVSFEKGISAIGAVSGATRNELEQLRKKALQLGADTVFSASEAAGAMEELAKAGVSTTDILSGAADATVALAAAGSVELTEAATIAATAMNNFNLEAKDLGRVADLIAGAANASSIGVSDFGFSLQQAGAVAKIAGINFDDTAVAIALLGKAGIRGSDAGTSLRTMFLSLNPTTAKQIKLAKQLGIITRDGANAFFDARGKAKSLAEISGVLQQATRGMTDQQKLATLEILFGTDAIRAAATLTEAGAAGFRNMSDAMGKVKAADVARKRLDNLAGSLEQLKGSFETFLITVGNLFIPVIREVVEFLTKLFNAFSDLPPGMQKLIVIAVAVTAALIALAGAFTLAVSAWLKFKAALIAVGVLRGVQAAVAGTTGAIVAQTAATTAATAGARAHAAAMALQQGAAARATGVFGRLGAGLRGLLGLINPVTAGIALLAGGLFLALRRVDPTAKGLARLRDATAQLKEAQEASRAAQEKVNDLTGTYNDVVSEAGVNSNEAAVAYRNLRDAQNELSAASGKVFDAQRKQIGGLQDSIKGLFKRGVLDQITVGFRDALQPGDETTRIMREGFRDIAEEGRKAGLSLEQVLAAATGLGLSKPALERFQAGVRGAWQEADALAGSARGMSAALGGVTVNIARSTDALGKQLALTDGLVDAYGGQAVNSREVAAALNETVRVMAEHSLAQEREARLAGGIVNANNLLIGNLEALRLRYPALTDAIDQHIAAIQRQERAASTARRIVGDALKGIPTNLQLQVSTALTGLIDGKRTNFSKVEAELNKIAGLTPEQRKEVIQRLRSEVDGKLAQFSALEASLGRVKRLDPVVRKEVVARLGGLVDGANTNFVEVERRLLAMKNLDPTIRKDILARLKADLIATAKVKVSVPSIRLDANQIKGGAISLTPTKLRQLEFALGGRVPGQGSRAIPAWVHPNEYVLRERAAQIAGDRFLRALNAVRTRRDLQRLLGFSPLEFGLGGRVPSASGGGGRLQSVTTIDRGKEVVVQIYNPQPAAAEDSINRQLRNLVYLGVL